ncbi:MAG: hypothetical protein J6J33_01205 [Clostridia bacterium]|nr:hypothetical protein [Clostridia bacterium]
MDKINNKTLGIFSEKSLNVLNIKDLRDIGFKIGVPAATTLKKQELIAYILKIIYGEVDATKRSSIGRPTVREFDMEKYVKKIEKKSIASLDEVLYPQSNEYGFVSKVASPSAAYGSEEEIEQRVYIEEDGKCYLRKKSFIKSDDDLEIESVYASKYSLENFDVLELLLINDSFKILTVNGIKVEDKFKDFELFGTKVKGGSRQVFKFSTKEEIDASILNLHRVGEQVDSKVFVFSKKNYISNNVSTVTYDETDSSSNIYKKFMRFISECEKKVFDGEDVIVVVDQTTAVKSAIDSFEYDVSERIKKHLQSEFTKILSLGNVLIIYELNENVIY